MSDEPKLVDAVHLNIVLPLMSRTLTVRRLLELLAPVPGREPIYLADRTGATGVTHCRSIERIYLAAAPTRAVVLF